MNERRLPNDKANEVNNHQIGVAGDHSRIDGGILFGDPDARPRFYHCPQHGNVLAQDVVWRQDGKAHCPECGAEISPASN